MARYKLNGRMGDVQVQRPKKVEVHHYDPLHPPGAVVRNILFIFTNHQGQPVDPSSSSAVDFTMEEFGEAFFNDPNGSVVFLEEASFGKLSAKGTVVGWLDYPADTHDGGGHASGTASPGLYAGAWLETVGQYLDLRKYDLVCFASTYWGLLNTGVGITVEGIEVGELALDQVTGVCFFHRPRVLTSAPGLNKGKEALVLPNAQFIHEIIHTLGNIHHALGLDCGPQTALSPVGNIRAYGDPFHVMGSRVWAAHQGAFHKHLLGWIDDEQLLTVTESGTHVLHPVELPGGEVYGLIIELASPFVLDAGMVYDRVCIDYRQPIGFDRQINNINDAPHLWGLRPDIDTDGVYIRLLYAASTGSTSTVLVNTHPEEPYDADSFSPTGLKGDMARNAHAMLNVGETFELPNTGTVTVLHRQGHGIEVEVVLE